ncbi:MAG: hypothetical protein JSR54_15705, partial [Proteobacteria bacterium]|nr:hypothetical protein [Pseudomonadota bacterium]
MSDEGFLRGAARAFATPPLVLTAAVAVLAPLGVMGGWLGLPLLAILGWWTWIYAFLLVRSTALGQPLPVLAVEHANPLHEPRPLGLLAALALGGSAAWAAAQHVPAPLSAAAG